MSGRFTAQGPHDGSGNTLSKISALAILSVAAAASGLAGLIAAPPKATEATVPSLKATTVLTFPAPVDFVAFVDSNLLVTSCSISVGQDPDHLGEHGCTDLAQGKLLWKATRSWGPAPRLIDGSKLVFVDNKTRFKMEDGVPDREGKAPDQAKKKAGIRYEAHSVRVVEAATGKELVKIDLGEHKGGFARNDKIYPDGKSCSFELITWGRDGKAKSQTQHFDLADGKALLAPKPFKSGEPQLFSPDGSSMVVMVPNEKEFDTIFLADVATDKVICPVPENRSFHYLSGAFACVPPTSPAESLKKPATSSSASAKDADTPVLFAAALGLLPKRLGGRQGGCLNGLLADPRFQAELRASDQYSRRTYAQMDKIGLYEARTGKVLARFGKVPVSLLAFSHDGRYLAAGHDPGTTPSCGETDAFVNYKLNLGKRYTIQLWDVSARKIKAELVGPMGGICTLAFSGDGSRLAAGSYDNKTHVWDLRDLGE
jgi:hypothetical protein